MARPRFKEALPQQRRTLPVSAGDKGVGREKEDAGNFYRCWHCGFVCDIRRDRLDTSPTARHGTVVESDTSLLLHFENDVTDSSLSAHTVTAVGTPTYSTTTKKLGNYSIQMDGSSQYLTVPDHDDFDFSGGYFTVEGWVNVDSTATTRMLYYQETAAVTDSLRIYLVVAFGSAQVYVQVAQSNSLVVNFNSSAGTIKPGRWHHIAVVENGDDWTVYADGQPIANTTSTSRCADYTGTVYLGAKYTAAAASQHFKGYLDEFRVSNIARWTRAFDVQQSPYAAGTYAGTPTGCPLCGTRAWKK